MEMFEVFRRQRRPDGTVVGATPGGDRASEGARPASGTHAVAPPVPGLIGTLHRPSSESAAERPAAPGISPFARLRAAAAEAGDAMGDRSIVVRYNTALLVLILLVGALFVAFAVGVEVGRHRATRDLAYTGAGEGAAVTPTNAGAGAGATSERPAVTPAGAQGTGTPVAGGGEPTGGRPTAPVESNRFWTIRLIHYELTAQGRSSAETMRKWTAARVGSGVYSATMKVNGEPQLAVCYGQFADDDGADAQAELKRVRALRDQFRNANLVLVERGGR